MKQIFRLFDFKQAVDYKTEILSGLTVAIALVPEAVAFALDEMEAARIGEFRDHLAACRFCRRRKS